MPMRDRHLSARQGALPDDHQAVARGDRCQPLPPGLSHIVQRATAARPPDRYPDVAELLEAVEAYHASPPQVAAGHPGRLVKRLSRTVKRLLEAGLYHGEFQQEILAALADLDRLGLPGAGRIRFGSHRLACPAGSGTARSVRLSALHLRPKCGARVLAPAFRIRGFRGPADEGRRAGFASPEVITASLKRS